MTDSAWVSVPSPEQRDQLVAIIKRNVVPSWGHDVFGQERAADALIAAGWRPTTPDSRICACGWRSHEKPENAREFVRSWEIHENHLCPLMEQWGVWSWPDCEFYTVTPATKENAEREAELADDEIDHREHVAVTKAQGALMKNAAAHARHKTLRSQPVPVVGTVEQPDNTELLHQIELAMDELIRILSIDERPRMSIPANPKRDTDLIIMAALKGAKDALSVGAATPTPEPHVIARKLYVADCWGVPDAGEKWDDGLVMDHVMDRYFTMAEAVSSVSVDKGDGQ